MTSRALLPMTGVDEIYVGKGEDPMLVRRNKRKGALWTPKTLISLGTPTLFDADYLVAGATSAELPDAAGSLTYATANDGDSPFDNAATPAPASIVDADGNTVSVWPIDAGKTLFGRNLTAAKSAGSVAMTVTIAGYDYLLRPLTETLSLGTGTTASATGKKAFAYVKSITFTGAADITGNTVNVGMGTLLGLPYQLEKIGHLTFASLGGVQELINVASNTTVVAAVTTTASATTGDVRGTIGFNTACDGSKEAIIEMYVSGRNSRAGLSGVVQA